MTDQFPGATKMVLSPAAQAVLTSVTQQEYCLDPSDIPNEAGRIGRLAAKVLRAVSEHGEFVILDDSGYGDFVVKVDFLRAIAAELEGQ